MDFETITEEDLIEMENMEPLPLTEKDKQQKETIEQLKLIEKKLDEVLKQLCAVTSSICNIVYKLNDMDKCILLRE